MKMYDAQKAKGLVIKLKYQKFQKLYNLVLVTCLAAQASYELTEGFRNSMAGQSPSHEKDLEIFSKSRFLDFL